jgi:hypothetical protein
MAFVLRLGFVNMKIPLLELRSLPARLAQLVERQFCKLDVAGSIPAPGSISLNPKGRRHICPTGPFLISQSGFEAAGRR